VLNVVCLLRTNISVGDAGTLTDKKCKRSYYDEA
jgi:hypothetical protein